MSSPAPARPTYPFDARPLVEPVDRAAASAFAAELRSSGRVPSAFGGAVAVIALVVGVIVVAMFGSIMVGVIGSIVASATGGSGGYSVAALLPFLLFVGFAVALIVLVRRGSIRQNEHWFRLDRFARANAMTFVPRFDRPGLPGMIFSLGSSRQASDLVRGAEPRFVEFGNYRYTTGSGKNQTTHKWGYVAVKLDVPLPHIVLDAVGNNAMFGSNLPATFDKDQRLSLEGDFDRYFHLYCPAGYERDALYLFTPDIMARFIDNAAALDVEIVDDWMFFYAKRDFSTLDPAMWAWLFSVVGAMLDKLAQWARWRDDRLAEQWRGDAAPAGGAASVPFTPPLTALRPPPGVAAPGRRLRRGIPWPAILVGGGVVLVWLLMQSGVIGSLFGMLFR